MKKLLKKSTAVLLAAIMMLSVMLVAPVTAGAATSGDFEYELLDDGTAEITGYTGEATELEIPSEIDGYTVTTIGDIAFYDCTSLTSITIPDSVTLIGGYTFAYCSSLASITVPDSVATIGRDAFYGTDWCDAQPDGLMYLGKVVLGYKGEMPEKTTLTIKDGTKGIAGGAFDNCRNLESITIPDSVTSIGDGAFSDCTRLASITIPDSVTSIGDEAFFYCTSLTNIIIPAGVTNIGYNPFRYCKNLMDISVQEGNENFYVVDGMLIGKECEYEQTIELDGDNGWLSEHKEGAVVISYPAGKEATEVIVPDEITAIGENAFELSKINSITFNEGLECICEYAFYYCDNLTSVSFPDSLACISTGAFKDCYFLETIDLNEGIEIIGYNAFDGCPLNKIELPKVFGTIAGDAFYDFSSESKEYEKSEILGYENTIAKKYTEDYGYTFISLGNTYDGSVKSGDYMYALLNDGTAEIVGYTGADTDLIIPAEIDGYTVTGIGAYAFSGCTDIVTATIPKNVTYIGGYAFYDCKNLTTVKIKSAALQSIGVAAFLNCESFDYTHYVGSYENWESIVIRSLNDDLVYGCWHYCDCDYLLLDWYIDDNGTLYISGSGVINPDEYSDTDDIPWYSQREEIKNIVVEDGITGIGNYSFMECCNLETVSIPASVTYIGDFVFILDMNSVQSINVDENNEYYTSVDGVLFNKDMTEIIKYPNGRSGSYTIPDTVTTIHTCAFRECAELTGLEIPDSVTTIDWYAFFDCDSLLSVTIPASVTEIPLGCGLGYKFHKGYDEPIDGFTIKGYTGTAAETYANENGFTFIALDKQEPTEVVLTDKNTNISVVTDTDAELVVETLTSREDVEAVYAVLGDTDKLITVYDISLVKDGATVQPDGAVTVKIPVSSESAKVYRIEADGTLTDMNAVFADGYLEFTTEHFSVYAVVEDEPEKLMGDVNGDGKYDIRDAAAIQLYKARLYIGEFDESVADVNGDGVIDVRDAAYIQLDLAKLL